MVDSGDDQIRQQRDSERRRLKEEKLKNWRHGVLLCNMVKTAFIQNEAKRNCRSTRPLLALEGQSQLLIATRHISLCLLLQELSVFTIAHLSTAQRPKQVKDPSINFLYLLFAAQGQGGGWCISPHASS